MKEKLIFSYMMPETKGRKNVNTLVATVELKDNYLESIEQFSADFEQDETGVFENEFRDRTECYLKNRICGFSKHYYCITKVWGVEIFMEGVQYNINICFKRNASAQSFCEALLNWLK